MITWFAVGASRGTSTSRRESAKYRQLSPGGGTKGNSCLAVPDVLGNLLGTYGSREPTGEGRLELGRIVVRFDRELGYRPTLSWPKALTG